MNRPQHVVVIGAGLAGLRTIEHLRRHGFMGDISLVGEEPHPPYDRPPLSKQVLLGAWPSEQVVLRNLDELAGLGVRAYLGNPAVKLRDGVVELRDGVVLEADAFVVATGAAARRLPGQPEGVHTLRTLEDALRLGAALNEARSVLIVGGGFIGAEVASGSVDKGLKVTIIEALGVPCERALGPQVGALCGRLIAEGGVDLRLGATLKRFLSDRAVELAGGEQLNADVVLVGIGASPSLGWIRYPGVDSTNGLACDARGRVHCASGLWAVGDASAWDDPARTFRIRNEHWTSAADQAAAVSSDILGLPPPPQAVPYFWSDQFGVKIQGVGRPDLADNVAPLRGDGLSGGAVKGTVAGYFSGDDRLVAVVGFGVAKWVARYRPLVLAGATFAETAALSLTTRDLANIPFCM